MRAAKAYIDQHPETLAESTPVEANPSTTRSHSKFSKLFAPHHEVPTFIQGFEISSEDREVMVELFPAGTEAARKMLNAFIHTKARKTQLGVSPLNPGAKEGEATGKSGSSRLGKYHQERDLADRDSSSRLSPYLAAGVISARELVRETMKVINSKKMVVGRDSGVGVWVQEIGKFHKGSAVSVGVLSRWNE
jgi:deoxyribodipyrimidine photo-lyase